MTEALFEREVSSADLPNFFAEDDVVARAAESEVACPGLSSVS